MRALLGALLVVSTVIVSGCGSAAAPDRVEGPEAPLAAIRGHTFRLRFVDGERSGAADLAAIREDSAVVLVYKSDELRPTPTIPVTLDLAFVSDAGAVVSMQTAPPSTAWRFIVAVAPGTWKRLGVRLMDSIDLWGMGIISDVDDTVAPAAKPDLSRPPFPGVRTLYRVLARRAVESAPSVHYVTARPAGDATAIEPYLRHHGMPAGMVETGASTMPDVVQAEKVKNIERILAQSPEGRRFVLFGDSTHRDPEVYQQVIATHPNRVVAVFIHRVGSEIQASRVNGLHVIGDYAEAATILRDRGVLSDEEARSVATAMRSGF